MKTSVVTIPWSSIILNSILKSFSVALGFNYMVDVIVHELCGNAYRSVPTLTAFPEVHRPNKIYFLIGIVNCKCIPAACIQCDNLRKITQIIFRLCIDNQLLDVNKEHLLLDTNIIRSVNIQ